MKEIKLTNSTLVALIDDEDFESVSRYNWRLVTSHRSQYAATGCAAAPYCNHQFLHEFITGTVKNTDHRDCNGLNNQRSNLRLATRSQNKANCEKYANNTSGYKGVTYRRERGTWRAQIRVNNKLTIIGCFHDKIEAAKAHDRAAVKYFGEFARLNFPIV